MPLLEISKTMAYIGEITLRRNLKQCFDFDYAVPPGNSNLPPELYQNSRPVENAEEHIVYDFWRECDICHWLVEFAHFHSRFQRV